MAVTLNDQKLLDQWGVVMEDGAEKDATVIRCIEELLQKSDLPGVRWERVEAQTSMFKGLFGNKRAYLMVTSDSVKDYRMYVGARAYGKHLDISWFLTVEPGFFKSAFSSMLAHGNYQAMSFNLDVFQNQDLRAYVTSVHRLAVRKAIEQVARLGRTHPVLTGRAKVFCRCGDSSCSRNASNPHEQVAQPPGSRQPSLSAHSFSRGLDHNSAAFIMCVWIWRQTTR